jgi:hypothetical protein
VPNTLNAEDTEHTFQDHGEISLLVIQQQLICGEKKEGIYGSKVSEG